MVSPKITKHIPHIPQTDSWGIFFALLFGKLSTFAASKKQDNAEMVR